MSKISNTSKLLSEKLLNISDTQDEKQRIIFTYAIERFINMFIFISIFAITLHIINITLLNITKPTVSMLISFYLIRSNFGGWHLEKDWQCLIFSIIIPLICGLIAYSIKFNWLMLITLYAFAIISVVTIGVVDNKNRPLSKKNTNKFTKRGKITLLIICIIHVFCFYYNKELIVSGIGIGVFVGFFNLYFGEKAIHLT